MATLLQGGYEKPGNPNNGALTVSARVGSPGAFARSAVPSAQDFVYAALLYPDGSPSEQQGGLSFGETADGGKIRFMFQKPAGGVTEGLTVKVLAFLKKEGAAEADYEEKDASLVCEKVGQKIENNEINIAGSLELKPNTAGISPNGTVCLKVKVPSGHALEIGGKDKDKFTVAGDSPNYTIEQNGGGIKPGIYDLTLVLKKGGEIVLLIPDVINVWPGMRTDTWLGLPASEVESGGDGDSGGNTRILSEDTASKFFFVLGSGEGWYSANYPSVTASDDYSLGSMMKPFATMQKAVDAVIARNDGSSDYTIYVDGKVTYGGSNANGMADFSSLAQSLSLTIKSLDASRQAALDADRKSRVIHAAPASGTLNLTIQDLAITGGNHGNTGGGICLNASGANITLVNCTIKGNTADNNGGGIYVSQGIVTMNGGTIGGSADADSNNAANGGGVYVASGGRFTMNASAGISALVCKNTATTNGGGIFAENGGSVTINDGTISNNTATANGGGVYATGTLIMTGGTIGGNADADGNTANAGGGVYIDGGAFDMDGGTISHNKAATGGGVYAKEAGCSLDMSGGIISGNAAPTGSGAYITSVGMFAMSGSIQFAEDDDIYLDDGDAITISGALTAESPVATITPSAYAADRQVLSADGQGVTEIDAEICKKFAVTPQAVADGESKEWKIAPSGDGTKGILAPNPTKFYVRGANAPCYDHASASDPWYGASAASDTNDGGVKKPFATIQKALDTVFAVNDGASEYTIYVDGTFTLDGSSAGLANINARNLRLKVLSLHLTQKATLDANKLGYVLVFDGNANSEITVERLVITGGKSVTTGDGWGSPGLFIRYGKAIITDCDITDNARDNTGGGGSLCIEYCDTVTMTSCTVSGNSFTSTSGSHIGGIFIQNVAAFNMTGCTISGNTSNVSFGGIYITGTTTEGVMTDCTVSGNIGAYGAILNGGKLTMKGCTVSGNTATGNASGDYAFGGGIYNGINGTLEIEDTEISGNTASSGAGIYSVGGTVTLKSGAKVNNNIKGGGICATNGNYASDFTTLIMEDGAEISGNTSTAESGGVLVNGGSTFTMEGGTISGNTTTSKGGGVYVGANGTFTMNSGTIGGSASADANKAQDGAGVYVNKTTDGKGTFVMNGGTIIGNIASDNGGGIYVNGGDFTMTDGTAVVGNEANAYGGGVYLASGAFTMGGGTISGNTAVAGAGGVYVGGGLFTMTDGAISGNTTDGDGGGVHVVGDTLMFKMTGGIIGGGTEVDKNTARNGGGVYITGSTTTASTAATFQMTGGSIEVNTADRYGGGAYATGSYVTIEGDGKINGNNAKIDGGGLWMDTSTCDISGGTISDNTATHDGKGIYVSASTVNLSGAVEVSAGNDIYLNGENTLTVAGAFDDATRTVATITPSSYTAGKKILEGAGVTMTQDICDQFTITTPDSGGNWTIMLSGTDGVLQNN